ncbi:MAG: hypothetical protein P1V18_02955 [Candidatus Gracilibacteria bacterium]|nr:hypothetical protein [Candidatus Gracilibacteria bacterium]
MKKIDKQIDKQGATEHNEAKQNLSPDELNDQELTNLNSQTKISLHQLFCSQQSLESVHRRIFENVSSHGVIINGERVADICPEEPNHLHLLREVYPFIAAALPQGTSFSFLADGADSDVFMANMPDDGYQVIKIYHNRKLSIELLQQYFQFTNKVKEEISKYPNQTISLPSSSDFEGGKYHLRFEISTGSASSIHGLESVIDKMDYPEIRLTDLRKKSDLLVSISPFVAGEALVETTHNREVVAYDILEGKEYHVFHDVSFFSNVFSKITDWIKERFSCEGVQIGDVNAKFVLNLKKKELIVVITDLCPRLEHFRLQP